MKTMKIEHVIRSNTGIRITGNLNYIVTTVIGGLVLYKIAEYLVLREYMKIKGYTDSTESETSTEEPEPEEQPTSEE